MMGRALEAARACAASDDVPVGCVIVRRGEDEPVASAGNAREAMRDPTAHAELLALRAAAGVVGSWRLDGTELFVTLEPCAMCPGAIVLARIPRVVYGATDPKAGAANSLYQLLNDERLNHRAEVTAGTAFRLERKPSLRALARGSVPIAAHPRLSPSVTESLPCT